MSNTNSPDDPFEISHELFIIGDDPPDNISKIPNIENVSMATYEDCDKNLIGNYSYCLEAACALKGIRNLSLVAYPGTIARVNGKDKVFSVFGETIYCPGKIYKNCQNKDAFREVVARANALMCIMSAKGLTKGKGWVSDKDVVALATDIFGEPCGSEIKIYFEIV